MQSTHHSSQPAFLNFGRSIISDLVSASDTRAKFSVCCSKAAVSAGEKSKFQLGVSVEWLILAQTMALAPASSSSSRLFLANSSLGSSFSEAKVSFVRWPSTSFYQGCRLIIEKEVMKNHATRKADPYLRICASSAVLEGVPSTAREDMAVVNVDLGDRSYPIYIGSALLDKPELLQRHINGKKVLVVTNTTVAPLYLDKVMSSIKGKGTDVIVESVSLPDGEKYKDMNNLMKVFDKAIETRMDRKCTFVALGGGVIGDMCGYAAASFLRGVNFIQIPTTVMAQVDSSVGGKTGVNHPLGKNLIGAFYQPQCVLVDTDTLNTLPDRELASGIAEVIKYGLIRDAPFFEWQEKNMEALLSRDAGAFTYAIKRSCESKAEVVSLDEREGGIRAILNLGHTFGHAIETNLGYGEWLHGEAVAAGTAMAADMSVRLGWIDQSLQSRILRLLERSKLPVAPPRHLTRAMFRSTMALDKKVADGQLKMILLKGPLGNCVFTADFDPKALEATLAAFCET